MPLHSNAEHLLTVLNKQQECNALGKYVASAGHTHIPSWTDKGACMVVPFMGILGSVKGSRPVATLISFAATVLPLVPARCKGAADIGLCSQYWADGHQ